MFGPGPVKVHQMKVLDSMGLEGLGHLQGILVVNLLGPVIPLGKADAFSIDDIYCRYQPHASLYFILSRAIQVSEPPTLSKPKGSYRPCASLVLRATVLISRTSF